MNYYFKIVLCICLCCTKLDSMSISGPAFTRYDPCNLGVIYFDKLGSDFWMGVINVRAYTDADGPVSIAIKFENKVKIFGGLQNSSLHVAEDWHNFEFKPHGNVTLFTFFLQLENIVSAPYVRYFSLNNVTLCDESIKASQKVETFNVTDDQKHYKHICGRKAIDNAELSSVTTESKEGDWPWHIALFIKRQRADGSLFNSYQCGGSIISTKAILTAGHCVSNKGILTSSKDILIVAGVNNHTDMDAKGRQERMAEKVILHPNYEDTHATADLAVIRVEKFHFTEFVQPICLWGPVYNKTNLFGYHATVVGFGMTEKNVFPQTLRSAHTMVQNDSTCIDFLPKVYEPLMNEFTLCAGYGPGSNNNPRNGDSGGGLVVPTMQSDLKISWFLRGVFSKCGVSPHHKNCDPTYYVVYTDIGPHHAWIYHHSDLQYTCSRIR